MATWILTGSPENYAVTAERGFRLIGMMERRRLQAEHWTLAFQGQLRTLSEHDADVLLEAMRACQVAGAGR